MLSSSNSSSVVAMEITGDACIYLSVFSIQYSWIATYLLLMPLFFWVFYVGYTQRKNCHTDIFTYHIIAMEILTMLGIVVYLCGGKMKLLLLVISGTAFYGIGMIGQMFIHLLTCLERYLAVVHPITYLRLKKRGGVMIRNSSIVVGWLLSVVIACFSCATQLYNQQTYVMILMFTTTFCIVSLVAFFNASVLCVLLRPGPGERSGDPQRIDQSKRRAFTTMIAIVSVLILRFILVTVTYMTYLLGVLNRHDLCLLEASAHYFTFPSSLVLPLLFLQRAGKLPKPSRFFRWCQRLKWHSG